MFYYFYFRLFNFQPQATMEQYIVSSNSALELKLGNYKTNKIN